MVGAASTSRAARGITPSDFTPLPPITMGARACTMPSEPCSPRWPPWSSQLWAAEWRTHRSGAAGESKSCAVCAYGEGVAALGGDLDEIAGLGALEGDLPAGREGLVAVVAAGEDHVDDRLERRVEQDLERPLSRLPVLVGDLVARVADGAGHEGRI